jgi:predicted negative regulator of RcsB-dependent stress response
VRSEVRHRLKEDRFAETAQGYFSWMREHSVNVVGIVLALTIAIALALGGYYYKENREQKASAALGSAMDTLNAPIGAADPESGEESFSSVKDRGQAAQKKFEAIASQYPYTHAGKISRYMIGVSEIQEGNNTAAEATFKQVSTSHDKDLASLAKMALASLYSATNRNSDAIAIYKDLADHPTHEVSKLAAQFELAGMYANTQPDEARKLYQEIQQNADPDSPIKQQVLMKMFSIPGGASPFPVQMPR